MPPFRDGILLAVDVGWHGALVEVLILVFRRWSFLELTYLFQHASFRCLGHLFMSSFVNGFAGSIGCVKEGLELSCDVGGFVGSVPCCLVEELGREDGRGETGFLLGWRLSLNRLHLLAEISQTLPEVSSPVFDCVWEVDDLQRYVLKGGFEDPKSRTHDYLDCLCCDFNCWERRENVGMEELLTC